MATKVATGQITIVDTNDSLSTGTTPPPNPVAGVTLWCDTSVTPSQIKRWNGTAWEIVNEVKTGSRNYYSLQNLPSSGSFRRKTLQLEPSTEYMICTTIPRPSAGLMDCWATSGQTITESSVINGVAPDAPRKVVSDASGWIVVSYRDTHHSAIVAGTLRIWVTKGNTATDWTPAPEDVQMQIDLITSDNVLDKSEKPSELVRWNNALVARTQLNSLADTFGITLEKTVYGYAFQSLANYLNAGATWSSGTPSWLSSMSTDTTIDGPTYRQKWLEYAQAEESLRTAITAKAKTLADNAQTTATAATSAAATALAAANTAQQAADNAQETADDAIDALVVIIDDDVLSAAEKPSMRQAWDVANAERTGIIAQATTFGVNSSAYDQAFVTLSEYLNDDTQWSSGVPLWIADTQLSTNTVIDGASMRVYWEDYYAQRQALLNAIALKAKTLADEAKTAANSLDYLKTAMADSTDISGGLLATSILLLKSAGVIKGGLSGVNADPVASWFGGTYAQAQADAVKAFKAAMSVGGLDRKDGAGHRAFGNFAWNAVGDIFVKGIIEAIGGKIGNYTIEAGSLVGRNSAGAEKIRLSDQPLAPLSTLSSGTVNIGEWPALADTRYIQADQEGNAAHFELYFDYPLMPFVIPYTTTAMISAGQYGVEYLSSPASVSSSQVFAMAFVYKDDGTLYWSGPVDTNFSIVGGGYKVKVRIALDIWLNPYGGTTVRYGMDDQGRGIQYTESVARSCFGLDGFFSYWSSALYMYMSQSAGLVYKGAMNIPGVLAAGTINADGSRDANKKWGAKNNTAIVTKSSAGTYVVPHSVGHSNYMVYVTPLSTGRTVEVVAYKTSTSFTVIFKVGSTNTDTAFDYMIVGAN